MAPAVRVVRIASDRLGYGTTKTDQTFAAIRAVGAEPLLLYMNWRDAPANVRRWVDRYGIEQLGLGNEVFYTSSGMTSSTVRSSARAYALQAKAIKQALPSTCKLLIEGDFPHFAGVEVPEIKAAVPDIAEVRRRGEDPPVFERDHSDPHDVPAARDARLLAGRAGVGDGVRDRGNDRRSTARRQLRPAARAHLRPGRRSGPTGL